MSKHKICELLSEYLKGDLSGDSVFEFLDHLKGCSACSKVRERNYAAISKRFSKSPFPLNRRNISDSLRRSCVVSSQKSEGNY